MRRKSQTAIKNAILLYYYLEFIELNYVPADLSVELPEVVFQILTFSSIYVSGHFKDWMFPYIMDSDIFSLFLRTRPEKHNVRSIAQLIQVSNCAFGHLAQRYKLSKEKQ